MVAGHTATDTGEEASELHALGVEQAVDDVLAEFDESTPEEIMALADARLESAASDCDRDHAFAVDDATFDGFVTEDVRPVSSAPERRDDREGEFELEELFGGR